MLRTILASFILIGVVSACSGDDDGGSGSGTTAAASCADLAKIWCSKGAGCTPGNEVTLVRPGSSETHDTEQMCVTFYGALGCGNAPTDAAWVNGCNTALASAKCAADGLEYPDACNW